MAVKVVNPRCIVNYPEGWGLVSVPKGIVPHDNIRVCPECHAQWNKALNEHFLKGTPLYKENI